MNGGFGSSNSQANAQGLNSQGSNSQSSNQGAGNQGAGTDPSDPSAAGQSVSDQNTNGLSASSDKLSSTVFGGGPIVGVVSLSAMDNDERNRNLSVMARIDTFRAVFTYAREIADGTDPGDLPPLSCAP